MNRASTVALFVPLLLSVTACASTPRPPLGTIATAVTDAGRPAADTLRDVNRKPAEVLAFAGVRPGIVVAELGTGGGYFTRLLAKVVGPRGKVLAIVTAAQAARPNGLTAITAIAAAYPNVQIVNVRDYASMVLPIKADLFWTTENYHDFHNGPTANIAGLNKMVFNNLKPGGIFYVEDHSSVPGAGLQATSTVHRMDEAVAKAELIAAGFRLDAESDLLRNPADNRAGSMSEAGHFVTDRFMLRMKK
jgi:predicted methyltransferase